MTSLTITRLTRPVFPAASLSLTALEAAPYGDAFAALVAELELAADDARVVTGDDGLDHYL